MVKGKSMGSGYRRSGEAVLERPADGRAASLSWEKAYHLYRPMLFGALSTLAKTGFAVPPDDGLDLIHDFFIEIWPAVQSNYDPAKAKLGTYLYRSFIHFARPRIVRSVRWRDSLLSPEHLSQRIDEREDELSPHTDNAWLSPDLVVMRSALSELPRSEKELLLCYLDGREGSERKLASRFSLTRYALRLKLSDALAQIAVKVGERGALTNPEWRFALALWRDKRTIREAAHIFNRPVGEVQEMRMNLFRNLVNSVHSSSDQGSDAAGGASTHAWLLLEAVLRPHPGPEAFHALREHAALVLAYLEHPSAGALFQKYEAELSAEKLADIYAALGSEEVIDETEVNIRDALLRASESEDSDVGSAFREVLVPALPDHLTNFAGRVFLGAPTVEPEIREALLSDISVKHGGPVAAELASFGLTPVTILAGSQGVADLARRFCVAEKIQIGQKLVLDRGGTRTHSGVLPILDRDLSIREVTLVTELPTPTSERLFDWLANVSSYTNHLFNGFDAELWGDELRLQRTDETVENLFERWFSPPKARVAA
jgi:hypothetical protein